MASKVTKKTTNLTSENWKAGKVLQFHFSFWMPKKMYRETIFCDGKTVISARERWREEKILHTKKRRTSSSLPPRRFFRQNVMNQWFSKWKGGGGREVKSGWSNCLRYGVNEISQNSDIEQIFVRKFASKCFWYGLWIFGSKRDFFVNICLSHFWSEICGEKVVTNFMHQ